jgi:hypothetical protein
MTINELGPTVSLLLKCIYFGSSIAFLLYSRYALKQKKITLADVLYLLIGPLCWTFLLILWLSSGSLLYKSKEYREIFILLALIISCFFWIALLCIFCSI